ncbi:serine/threonine-protein kinase Chk2 [Mugil cephalus]|uniref:serine/threonine-protein kinase Chk2 n=1 Tax=Mugil cephalus TaxID=48193 RepID=UPI001FB78442|nr:serine/threonine-protein kinase Chk2 [Mugil cephalus]
MCPDPRNRPVRLLLSCRTGTSDPTNWTMSEEVPPEGNQPQTQSQTQSTQSTQSTLPMSQSQSQPGSSSSSGPTSASQSSSGSGTVSSVDTIPVTMASVPEEPEPQPWGRLLPMAEGFRSHDCIEDQYLFGRDSRCNYVLSDPHNRERFRIYSKRHFRIYREGSEVFVEDLSNNGTFVDGIPIGQNMKLPLVNNSVLSLSEQRNRVFVFMDLMSDDQSSLPKDLQRKYVLTRQIGTGVCGEVRLAFERSTCKKVAVKIINKKNFQSEGTATRNAQTEIEILKRVDHPCLIKTEDFYQTEDSYYIVLELMEGGELFHRVKSQQQLKESVAKLYFYQMLCAVQYLHSNGIIHRDLKPENILLSSHEDDCLIKVTDFNQSRILEEVLLMRTLCGTPSYLAPEVFTSASTTGYSLAVDAWSLGVLLFVCLSGYPPFHQNFSSLSITDQIISGKFTMVQSKWRNVSDQAKDLVQRLLVVDPSQRMSIEDALQHPWIQDPVMLDTAHRLMYPTHETPSTSGAESRRKRGRDQEDQEDKEDKEDKGDKGDKGEERPAKRRQAPPPATP